MKKNEQKNQPERKFRAGAISATMWKSKDDGKTLMTVFEKSYKNAEGEWKTTGHFTAGDLAAVAWLARQCFEFQMARER